MFYTVGNSENEGKGHLCHTIRAIGWDVGNDDALFLGSFDIYHIETCSLDSDVLQVGKLRQCFCIHLYLV